MPATSNVVPFPERPRSYPHEVPLSVVVVPDVDDDGVGVDNGSGESSLRLRDELDADLARLGVCYRPRIFRRFHLEEIALALRDVQDALSAGRVHNPGGLFIRVLEGNTGRAVFR